MREFEYLFPPGNDVIFLSKNAKIQPHLEEKPESTVVLRLDGIEGGLLSDWGDPLGA